jgi:hypothetical protein
MDDTVPSYDDVYALKHREYQMLEELRTQLLMMALLTRVNRSGDDETVLLIPRSILAQNYAVFAAQLTDVLSELRRIGPATDGVRWAH